MEEPREAFHCNYRVVFCKRLPYNFYPNIIIRMWVHFLYSQCLRMYFTFLPSCYCFWLMCFFIYISLLNCILTFGFFCCRIKLWLVFTACGGVSTPFANTERNQLGMGASFRSSMTYNLLFI